MGAFGLMKDDNYTYVAQNNTCKYDKSLVEVKPKSYKFCLACKNKEATSFLKNGPYFAAIDAKSQDFQLYKSGVIPPVNCGLSNHAIIVVQATSQFIKIRNSWGPNWGENGYVRVQIDAKTNSCHSEEMAFQPQL